MPTYDALDPFWKAYQKLTAEQQQQFRVARREPVQDLQTGGLPRPALRVKRVVTHPGIWEMTWKTDGRASFSYGESIIPGERHVIWRRIGTHEIFDSP